MKISNKNKAGFTLVELAMAMGVASTLSLVSMEEDRMESYQDKARAMGNEIFQYNAGVSRYLAAFSGDPSAIGVTPTTSQSFTGSDWLKGPGCSGGASKDYLSCMVMPDSQTVQYHSVPSTEVYMTASGGLEARTTWSQAIADNGAPSGMIMGIAALVASGNYVSQAEDGASGYQLPTVYCPDMSAYGPELAATCGSDRNKIVSTANTNSTIEPWLRTDHGNTMRHVIEYDGGAGAPLNQAMIDGVDDGAAVGGWSGSGMRQMINIARLYNRGGSGQDSVVIGARYGKTIFSDGFITSNNLLQDAMIVDGDAAVMKDIYVKSNAFIEGNSVVQGDSDVLGDAHVVGDLTVDANIEADTGYVRGNYIHSLGDVRADRYGLAQRYYDINNGSKYLDPSARSQISDMSASGDIRATTFYDIDNTSFYANPASRSQFNALTINNVGGNALVVDGRIRTNEFLDLNRSVSHGGGCSVTGLVARTSAGDVVSCKSGTWQMSDTPGQYSFFATTSCPPGWVKANGSNGTVDLRGEFVRAWDNGKGVDGGRSIRSWQGDMIKRHKHAITLSHEQSGSHDRYGFPQTDWSGPNRTHSASQPDGSRSYRDGRGNPIHSYGGNESRPRNRALLACMKK